MWVGEGRLMEYLGLGLGVGLGLGDGFGVGVGVDDTHRWTYDIVPAF